MGEGEALQGCRCSRKIGENFFRPEGGFTLTTDSEAPGGARESAARGAMAVAILRGSGSFYFCWKRAKVDWIHISREMRKAL